jgi:hypothetical protein
MSDRSGYVTRSEIRPIGCQKSIRDQGFGPCVLICLCQARKSPPSTPPLGSFRGRRSVGFGARFCCAFLPALFDTTDFICWTGV